jgi:hypothetical protein
MVANMALQSPQIVTTSNSLARAWLADQRHESHFSTQKYHPGPHDTVHTHIVVLVQIHVAPATRGTTYYIFLLPFSCQYYTTPVPDGHDYTFASSMHWRLGLTLFFTMGVRTGA